MIGMADQGIKISDSVMKRRSLLPPNQEKKVERPQVVDTYVIVQVEP